MTPEQYRAFNAELKNMTTLEVRQNTEPSHQSDARKRAMAVTELERRRQLRAPDTIKDPLYGRPGFLIVVILVIAVAAYLIWL